MPRCVVFRNPLRTAKLPECQLVRIACRENFGAIFFFDRPFIPFAPKFEDMPIVVMEQGVQAEAPFRAMNRTIDRVIKTAVFSRCNLISLLGNG